MKDFIRSFQQSFRDNNRRRRRDGAMKRSHDDKDVIRSDAEQHQQIPFPADNNIILSGNYYYYTEAHASGTPTVTGRWAARKNFARVSMFLHHVFRFPFEPDK